MAACERTAAGHLMPAAGRELLKVVPVARARASCGRNVRHTGAGAGDSRVTVARARGPARDRGN